MRGIISSYEKIPTDDSSTAKIIPGSSIVGRYVLQYHNKHAIHLFVANCVLFCISIILCCLGYFWSTNPSSISFVEKFSSYSPARSAVSYVSGTFNSTQGAASGYVGTSNETDEMWEWVTSSIGDQMITPEELKLVEKPTTSIKVKDPKTVRMGTFGDHYKGRGDFADKDETKIRNHLDHCLEMLRMNLMCQVDIGVITFHELPGKTGDPWPDFSTKHVCRDFDRVRRWAIDNAVAYDNI